MQDAVAFIRDTLLNGQATGTRSITTKLPFPYHLIPGEIRTMLRNIVFRSNVSRMRKDTSAQPRPYADDTLDRTVAAMGVTAPAWAWPHDKKCAVVLSHDTDTGGQERGITGVWQLAQRLHLPTTISFVGQFIDSYAPLISDLRRTGADIALHDIAHTNDIAFMDRSTIVERLKRAAEWRSAYGITGFRSPSWYVSAALWNALDVCGFSYDMSALDTWPFFSKESNHGVRTFLPFGVGNLVVLPNTIPFDDMPGIVGYKPEELFAFWKPKIDAIAASGGLIMLNAHPDKWLSGNPRMLDSLGVVLRYILDTHDPARMTAREVAEHFRSQRFRGAVIDIPGEPLLAVPVATAPGSSWSIADSDNPCIQTRGAFLRKRHH